MIPAFEDAKRDKALRGDLSMIVYLHLLDTLDPVDFREVKQVALAALLECSERTIWAAIEKLVDLGYLKRGKVHPGEPRRYRLIYSRMP